MHTYLFVFGRDPLLGFAELISLLKTQNQLFTVNVWNGMHAILFFKQSLDVQALQKTLGGTLKIAEVIAEGNEKEFKEASVAAMQNETLIAHIGKKCFYSFTDLSSKPDEEYETLVQRALLAELKKEKCKAVLKHPSRQTQLKIGIAPSDIHSWKLLQTGLELLLLKEKNRYAIAKTITAFNPDTLKIRDEKRPYFRKLHAVSLRIANILIHLSQAGEGTVLLDPFCGIGTIIQEGVRQNIVCMGSDIDEEVAAQAQENITWFIKKFKANGKATIQTLDAQKLSNKIKHGSVGAVATEPYLGPFLTHKPTEEDAQKTIRELTILYTNVFKELAIVMKPKAKIAILLPQLPTATGKKYKVNESLFKKQGFVSINPIQAFQENAFPYLYGEESKTIDRLLYILEKQ